MKASDKADGNCSGGKSVPNYMAKELRARKIKTAHAISVLFWSMCM